MGFGVPYGLAVQVANPPKRRPQATNNFRERDFKASSQQKYTRHINKLAKAAGES
jgi:hypothetical protein